MRGGRFVGRITLLLGEEMVLDWRGQVGSDAMHRAIRRVYPPTEPVQSWAGLTKKGRR